MNDQPKITPEQVAEFQRYQRAQEEQALQACRAEPRNPQTKQEQEQTPIRQLGAWLQERNAELTVQVKTPKGEMISPDNFIPAGWVAVIGIVLKGEPSS